MKKLIETNCVLLNEKKVKSGEKLKVGQNIKVFVDDPKPLDVLPEEIDINIVYQDNDLAVINKQAGLVVHPANGNERGTLVNALLNKIDNLSGINGVIRPGIVHRLDKDTSGLLVVAKNDFAHVNLSKQIETKTCKRCYLALCNGVIKHDEGVIKTVKRLNYRDCNLVLENGVSLKPDYQEVYPYLVLMKELAEKLYEKKHKRGALDFDIPEIKVNLDDLGKAVAVEKIERGISEHIIEEFMIVANETVAEFIENMELPFIYRVHDEPDGLKFQNLKMIVRNLGYKIKSLHPLELQKLLEYIEDEGSYLKTMILRLMAKAVYSENNIGHFGLASKSYTHFTSPIRRYPDLLVHRLIRKYIFNHEIDAREFLDLTQKISDIANHSSKKEREAFECEMKVLDMKKTEYMENFIGEKFKGTISSVTRFGVFVTVLDGIDGLVHVSNMEGDYFEYDSYNNQYVGRRSNKKIKIGDAVDVILISALKENSEIDFKLVYNSDREKHSYYKQKRKNQNGKNKESSVKGRSGKKNKNNRKK